jgi:hypothetical protein
MHSPSDTFITGAIGTFAPMGAIVISLDPAIEAEFRILSLFLGIVVGLASLAKICYDWYRIFNRK